MKQLRNQIRPLSKGVLLRSIVVFALLSLSLVMPYRAFSQTLGQLLPYTDNGSDTYLLQDAYMTAPNVSVRSGHWAAGPNGLSSPGSAFIESGAIKDCRNGRCKLVPYASWQTSSGEYGFKQLSQNSLVPGGLYRYKVYNIGGNNWETVFCSGNGCYSITTVNLGIDSLLRPVSGGESSSLIISFGSITTKFNRAYKNGRYVNWCYTDVIKNVNGSVSECDQTQYAWSVEYFYE